MASFTRLTVDPGCWLDLYLHVISHSQRDYSGPLQVGQLPEKQVARPLEAKPWKSHNIISTTSYWLEQVTKPAQVQGDRETDATSRCKGGQYTNAQRHAYRDRVNMWL